MSATVTPAAKIQVVELAVMDENDRYVGVRYHPHNDEVTVTWFCGDARTFARDDLDQAIGHLDAMASYSDVWVTLKDTRGTRFAGRVENGRLYADRGPVDDARSVSWDALREAIGRFREGNE